MVAVSPLPLVSFLLMLGGKKHQLCLPLEPIRYESWRVKASGLERQLSETKGRFLAFDCSAAAMEARSMD